MGRKPCCDKVGLKKGKWTSDEDQILIKYILAHGEGSWRALPKNAGLLRCGKSCRLRWINYLRSDLKRGNITEEEEGLIVKLHATLGNRWSLIAGHLPGRTDNEIKNYWNSHLSRKLLQPSASVETKSSTSSSPGNLPPPEILAVEDSSRRPNTKKKKPKTAATTPPPEILPPGTPRLDKESHSTISCSGSLAGEEFSSCMLDEMLWESDTCQLLPAMVDQEAETCYWDDLFGTVGVPDSVSTAASSSSSYHNVGEAHHDDMFSWLWDVEDFGGGGGNGGGGFDNGNSCNMVAGDDDKHNAMVAWLLS